MVQETHISHTLLPQIISLHFTQLTPNPKSKTFFFQGNELFYNPVSLVAFHLL